ncbi:MAG: nickel-binding protein [Tunicatimonas sp.]
MPMYMDFHQFETVSVEAVKEAHMADKLVQDRYGVRYIQFWVNEAAGTVFCLVEGPNPEACEACHRIAHGNMACNLQEVEPGFFKLFMGDKQPIHHGLAMNTAGAVDLANRTLLVADIRGVTDIEDSSDYKQLHVPIKPKNRVVDALAAFDGRFIEHAANDSLVGVFDSPINAIRCAQSIQNDLLEKMRLKGKNSEWNIIFRLALNQGQPLTKSTGFFEVATKQAIRLCMVAGPNQIVFSSNLQELYAMENVALEANLPRSCIKILTPTEENFLHALFELTEQHLQTTSFNVNNLCELIGVSRPQLYRKTTSLTGKSPNNFIKDLRMQKAWRLLKSREGNISEVALEVGYSNPSYFSKVFQASFGHKPSALAGS